MSQQASNGPVKVFSKLEVKVISEKLPNSKLTSTTDRQHLELYLQPSLLHPCHKTRTELNHLGFNSTLILIFIQILLHNIY